MNLLSILLERRTQFHAQAITATQQGDGTMQEYLRQVEGLLAQGGIADGLGRAMAQDHLGQAILAQASMLAFRDSVLAVAVMCLLALIPVAIMRQKPSG